MQSALHVRLRKLRKENNMTQSELGKRVGVIKQTVSSWENNTSAPNHETICTLAKLFEVSTDYLLGLTNDRKATLQRITFDEMLDLEYGGDRSNYALEFTIDDLLDIEKTATLEEEPSALTETQKKRMELQRILDELPDERLDGFQALLQAAIDAVK